MPYYDLKCKCGQEFNHRASIKEREENRIACPACGNHELEAVFKTVNVVLSKENTGISEGPCGHRCNGRCGH